MSDPEITRRIAELPLAKRALETLRTTFRVV
jgi:hypothetical protein